MPASRIQATICLCITTSSPRRHSTSAGRKSDVRRPDTRVRSHRTRPRRSRPPSRPHRSQRAAGGYHHPRGVRTQARAGSAGRRAGCGRPPEGRREIERREQSRAEDGDLGHRSALDPLHLHPDRRTSDHAAVVRCRRLPIRIGGTHAACRVLPSDPKSSLRTTTAPRLAASVRRCAGCGACARDGRGCRPGWSTAASRRW